MMGLIASLVCAALLAGGGAAAADSSDVPANDTVLASQQPTATIMFGLVRTSADLTRLAPDAVAARRTLSVEPQNGWSVALQFAKPITSGVTWRFGVGLARHEVRIVEEGGWLADDYSDRTLTGGRTACLRQTVVELPVAIVFDVPLPDEATASSLSLELGLRFDLGLRQASWAAFQGWEDDTHQPVDEGVAAPPRSYDTGYKFILGAEIGMPTRWRTVRIGIRWAADLCDRTRADGSVRPGLEPDSVTEYLWQGLREQTVTFSAGFDF